MIAEFLEQIAAEAAGLGIAATTGPGRAVPMLAQGAPVLLVDAPTVTTVGLSGAARVQVPLLLIPPPPGDEQGMAATYAALQSLLPVFPGEWAPTRVQIGELVFPALRMYYSGKV